MPRQDFITSWQRHAVAVAEMSASLKGVGIGEHLGSLATVPPYHFALAPLRSVEPQHGIMPRDIVMRLAGTPFSLKVFATNGGPHSSLFRSVAYSVLSREGEGYIQIVMGGPPTPIKWLTHIQGPVDLDNPSGIHGIQPFLAAVKDAVLAASSTASKEQPNELG